MSAPSQSTSEHLDQLLDVEVFPPPADFGARAKVTDPAVHEQAAADAPAWWAGQARQRLHWQTPFQAVLDDSDPPFYTWFADGALNASYNCLDRHVEAGRRPGRLPLAGGAGRAALPDVRRDPGGHPAPGQRAEGPGSAQGRRRGIYLPMIPEVVVAMLACARIGAPHNVGRRPRRRVQERMATSQARALITTDGARRRGKTAPVKQAVDEGRRPGHAADGDRRPVDGYAVRHAARP